MSQRLLPVHETLLLELAAWFRVLAQAEPTAGSEYWLRRIDETLYEIREAT
jgi:hypothetical protein